jgi:hypothetical protein
MPGVAMGGMPGVAMGGMPGVAMGGMPGVAMCGMPGSGCHDLICSSLVLTNKCLAILGQYFTILLPLLCKHWQ